MENGNKMKLHLIAIGAFVIFIVLGLACAHKPPVQIEKFADTSESYIEMYKDGQVKQVDFTTDIVTIKDFVTLGLIFVESSVTIGSDDKIIAGSKITFDMLMKEAQKLDADDIINLRIDETQNISVTEEMRMVPTKNSDGKMVDKETKVQIVTKTIVYKANALAIKYLPAK